MTRPLAIALLGLAVGVLLASTTDLLAPAPPSAPSAAAARRPAAHRPALPAAKADKTRFVGLAPTLAAEERARPVSVKLAALHHPVRQRQLPAAAIIAALDVRPGQQVVDIGAGGGLLSVPLARAVTPDGRVFAVDVDARLVAALEARVAAEGLKTLVPRHVAPEGDPFYASERFDRVLMCAVFEYLRSPTAFFAELRPSIRPGGLLAIVQGRTAPTYLPSDFDGPFALERLRADGDTGPLWRRLPGPLRRTLGAVPTAAALDAATRDALAAALRAQLDDPALVVALAAHVDARAGRVGALWDGLGVDDRALAAEIFALFDDAGLWDGAPATTPAARAAVRTLNWLALLRYFPRSLPREIYPRGIYLSEAGIVRRLERVGFRKVRSVDSLAAHDLVLLAPVDRASGGAPTAAP